LLRATRSGNIAVLEDREAIKSTLTLFLRYFFAPELTRKITMAGTNRFQSADVQLAGIIAGGDEAGHYVFSITPKEGAPLYGEYSKKFEENGNDFNIEIGLFGYSNNTSVGTTHPAFRAAFSAEDCFTVERLIRTFFSSSTMFPTSIRAGFLGGVCFRPNWIVQEALERR
jgi:hypothetical protein